MNTAKPIGQLRQRLALFTITTTFLAGWYIHLTSPKLDQDRVDTDALLISAPIMLNPQPDLLSLADLKVARKLRIAPEHHLQIARIDAELDHNATIRMVTELKRWNQRGGFHVESIPNFRDRLSPYGSELAEMKREAEERIMSLLSSEEQRRWLNQPSCLRRAKMLSRPMKAAIQLQGLSAVN